MSDADVSYFRPSDQLSISVTISLSLLSKTLSACAKLQIPITKNVNALKVMFFDMSLIHLWVG